MKFLSASSARRATRIVSRAGRGNRVSITSRSFIMPRDLERILPSSARVEGAARASASLGATLRSCKGAGAQCARWDAHGGLRCTVVVAAA